MELHGVERSLSQALTDGAERQPAARLIVVSPDRPADLTLAELAEQGRRFGAHLRRLGIMPGDVVAVQLPAWTGPETISPGCSSRPPGGM